MDGEMRLRMLIAEIDGAARREISLAAGEGRFDELFHLTSMAKEIAGLAARWPCEGASVSETQVAAEPVKARAAPSPPATVVTPKTTARLKQADYPQFLREKLELVKLGWSPGEKGPYEHRVPRAAVDAVSSAVAAKGKAGHRFTMDEVLKALVSAKLAKTVPSYQTYAVVSWLKWAGMVLQHGRQGYTVVRPQTFSTSIETAWQSLPQR